MTGTRTSNSNLLPPPKLGDTKFSYQPLDPTRNEVRVLIILPYPLKETLRCQIKHVDLDDYPEFTALSYAWGDPSDTRFMFLCNEHFPITRSLWGALQALRSTTSEVIIWADAVCINQSDEAERNVQVGKMTMIYSSASTVALWLGPARDESYDGLQLLENLVLGGPSYMEMVIESRDGYPKEFEALVKIFERSYWQRLWCVQEIWNATKIMVYCGSFCTSWSAFKQAQSILSRQGGRLAECLGYYRAYDESWPTILQTGGPGRMPGRKGLPDFSLFQALVAHRDKLCTDPKDKIFAILGLLDRSERLLFYNVNRMDYSCTVRKIFTSVVNHHLRTKGNLNILCASTPGHNPHCLPSWVPDWTTNDVRKPLVLFDGQFSAASSTTASQSYISENESSLFVSGVLIDQVHRVYNDTSGTNDFESALLTYNSWRTSLCDDFGADPEIHHAFCRAICLNQIYSSWTGSSFTHFIYSAMHKLLRGYTAAYEPDRRLEMYDNAISLSREPMYVYQTFLRLSLGPFRLVVTNTPLLGLGAGEMEPGDRIAVLLGCGMPVVLRKIDNGAYKFIGEIYVDGYMYGRAIEELNDGTRQLQTFELI